MPLKIRYSLRALDEELALLTYLRNEFGPSTARKVYQDIEFMLAKIVAMPDMFPVSIREPGLRKCVLSRRTSIYYRVVDEYLEVISIRDNRMDATGKL